MAQKILKKRLDILLVEQGLIENPSKARARIMAGDIIVNDHRVDKPGAKFAQDIKIRIRGNSCPYVSRGGLKLVHALNKWEIITKHINNSTCLDIGASTGGFSHVLLEHGAKKIYCVDVGYGQLAEKLRTDIRIINIERTHILNLSVEKLDPKPSIITLDLSFISLTRVLEHVFSLSQKPGFIICLIKPQFEVGRNNLLKGGLVKDPELHKLVIEKIKNLSKKLGAQILGVEESPILGAKGNIEFLLGLKI